MSIETMTKISTVTVGAGGSASISFSNIPQGYTDLVLKLSTRTTASGWTTTGLVLTLNGSSASVYSRRTLYNTSAGSAGSDSTSSTTSFVGGIVSCGASATSNTFGTANVYIPNYSDSNYKNISVESVSENNGTDTAQTYTFGLFANPSPITSLTLTDANGGSFVQHSIATLYGVKDAAKTAGNSIKAIGGNISFDGTYVTHTFTSSGAFTPTQPLLVDYLVVAGGGGGFQGGGGAGGLRSTVTATGGGGTLESALSLASGIAQTVTIGAGGAAQTSGANSSFSTIASTGGGRGGSFDNSTAPSTGGSGGGGGGADGAGYSGAAGTANQGRAGGTGFAQSGVGPAGGGGGSANVGSNGVSGAAGAGGSGVGINITGSSVTYAGGGGGGIYNDVDAGGGGAGGGGAGGFGNSPGTAGTAGTANTGSGGGGAGFASAGAGGSGIVIIRYKG